MSERFEMKGTFSQRSAVTFSAVLTFAFVIMLLLAGRFHIIGYIIGIPLCVFLPVKFGRTVGYFRADHEQVTFMLKRRIYVYYYADISQVAADTHLISDKGHKPVFETVLTITDKAGDAHSFTAEYSFGKSITDDPLGEFSEQLEKSEFTALATFIQLMMRFC